MPTVETLRGNVEKFNTKEAKELVNLLAGLNMSWSSYDRLIEAIKRLDALTYNRSLDEALNSGDGSYKP